MQVWRQKQQLNRLGLEQNLGLGSRNVSGQCPISKTELEKRKQFQLCPTQINNPAASPAVPGGISHCIVNSFCLTLFGMGCCTADFCQLHLIFVTHTYIYI